MSLYWLSILLLISHIFYIKSLKQVSNYKGEYFPHKYLETDAAIPVYKDLSKFILALKKTVDFLTKKPNNTDCNVAVGTYLMTSVLRRSLLDYSNKLNSFDLRTMKNIIKKGENYLSHYIYYNRPYGYRDMEYRVSVLYKDVDIFAQSMNNFNEKRLLKWLHGDFEMHQFVRSIDNATLRKEMYIYIIDSMHKFHVNITESDECLSRIMETPEPLDSSKLQPCRADDYCKNGLLATPSIGYSLSHRLLNMLFRRNVRRCYLQSVEEDEETIDSLCAFMYREVVYLARRGYFARDIFLEHIALCATLGYKEFHRLHWFNKALSWMDEAGCMHENHNYLINSTRLYKQETNSSKQKKIFMKNLKKMLINDCQTHPMTLLTVVLAHAIRYVAHVI